MRWAQFVILVFLLVVLQTTLCSVVQFKTGSTGSIRPDLLAMAAVFVALAAPNVASVMMAAWVLGFAVDLTAATSGGAPAAVGPMALAYALGGWMIFKMREAVFSQHIITQAMLALVFCLLAHLTWVTVQAALGGAWGSYSQLARQAIGVSLYTAVLMPVGYRLLSAVQGVFIDVPVRRTRRSRSAGR